MILISVGSTCETAFEIRMHTPKGDADFFDWLITPFDALVGAIRSDFTDLLRPEDLYLQDDKNFVVNRATGIKYGHVFKRDGNGDIITDFLSDLDRVVSIFRHLKGKLDKRVVSGEPLGFVRRGLTPDEAVMLRDTIADRYPALAFKIIAVNATPVDCAARDPDRFIDLTIPDSGPDGLGHADAWGAALVAAGLTDTPHVRTKDQVFHRLMVHQVGDVNTLIEEARAA